VRRTDPLASALVFCLAPTAAFAAPAAETRFDIPSGPLSRALTLVGAQAQVTLVANDPRLSRLRSRALRGRMTVSAALQKLLAGSGYGFVEVAPDTFRIVALPPRRPRAPVAAAPAGPHSLRPADVGEGQEIVVTASKQGLLLANLPATAAVISISPEESARRGSRGSEAIVSRLPMLASTNLGPGRNKLYIRGIADSSFNGPSQSITAQYLGDLRLTFNAPDPDLRLFDVGRVELLEGPQGTLYGSGSLGGILRLVPNPPELGVGSASFSAGLSATRDGGIGSDAAATLNAPLVADMVALRSVVYAVSEGGWIDNLGRSERDVNRTRIRGGRAALFLSPGDGWWIELEGVAQFVAGRDGQYAERGLPPLTRVAHLRQPYDNDYLLGGLTVRRSWNGLELVSATSIVDHTLDSRFDATGGAGIAGTQLFREDVAISLFAHETRLSRTTSAGTGWVAGLSLVRDISRVERSLGPPAAAAPLTGVSNAVREASLFGQLSFTPWPRLIVTAGARATWSKGAGTLVHAPDREENEPSRTDFRMSPTLALSWRPSSRLLFYARYQDAFRAGGVAVSATGSAAAAQRFESDELASSEIGLRYGSTAGTFSANLAISYARWTDIQADLVDSRGLPFTTNIGDGRIYAAEAKATWRPAAWLAFDASAFLADSTLDAPAPAFSAADERSLPNIAEAGGRGGVRVERRIGASASIGFDASVRYVGRSHLGIGPPLDTPQGGYAAADVGLRIGAGGVGLSLDIENATDTRGNRFSYGNPFTVAQRLQITPLRPRTVRLGIDLAF
jgi:iron complex outermembrane receptor protein